MAQDEENKNLNVQENAFEEDDGAQDEVDTKLNDQTKAKHSYLDTATKKAVSDKDVDILVTMLLIDTSQAEELLVKYDGDMTKAFRSYIEPSFTK